MNRLIPVHPPVPEARVVLSPYGRIVLRLEALRDERREVAALVPGATLWARMEARAQLATIDREIDALAREAARLEGRLR